MTLVVGEKEIMSMVQVNRNTYFMNWCEWHFPSGDMIFVCQCHTLSPTRLLFVNTAVKNVFRFDFVKMLDFK
jgi:hypothetical protein